MVRDFYRGEYLKYHLFWVFTWEAVDIFFLQRPKLHKEQQRNFAAMNAEIVFECD